MVTSELYQFLVEPFSCGHIEAGMVSWLVSASKNRPHTYAGYLAAMYTI